MDTGQIPFHCVTMGTPPKILKHRDFALHIFEMLLPLSKKRVLNTGLGNFQTLVRTPGMEPRNLHFNKSSVDSNGNSI